MGDKRYCDDICHEDDILCHTPIKHCCGGYSEHNNCCPHDRCCNQWHEGCCGDCCDGACCCRLKKTISKIQDNLSEKSDDLVGLKNRLTRDEENAEEAHDNLKQWVDEIDINLKNEIDNVNRDLKKEADTARYNEGVNADAIAALAEKEDADFIDAKAYAKKLVDDLVDGADTAYDTLKEIADELMKDNNTEVAILNSIAAEKDNREAEDQAINDRISDLRNLHDNDKNALEQSIAAEISRATTKETNIEQRINATQDYREVPEFGKRKNIAKVNNTDITVAIPALPEAIKNPYALTWAGIDNGSYDGSVGATINIPTNLSKYINDTNYQNRAQVALSISDAIADLDSSISAEANKAIASVVVTDGKISAHSKVSIPTKTSDITNNSGYMTDLSASGNLLHYHNGGSGWVDVTVPYATTATNADLTKTINATNGDEIRVGSGKSVNITNAAHAVNADNATKATNDAAGNSIINTYARKDSLSTVATTGNYNNLNNLPTIVDGIGLQLNPNTFEISAQLKSGSTIVATSPVIDLPLETMVVGGTYNNTTKKVVLTLKNGQQIEFSVAELVSGLANSSDLAPVATSGNYNDLTNKPTIPTVNNATLTIQKNGANIQTFTANQASPAVANITVPTKTSDLTNDSGYITQHQSLSNYATKADVTDAINGLDSSATADSGYALTGVTIENGKITSKSQVALPTPGASSVTINGSSYTIQQAIDYILGLLLWEVSSTDSSKIVAKNSKSAQAAGFYDSTVS